MAVDHTEYCRKNNYACLDPVTRRLCFPGSTETYVHEAEAELGADAPQCAILERAEEIADDDATGSPEFF